MIKYLTSSAVQIAKRSTDKAAAVSGLLALEAD